MAPQSETSAVHASPPDSMLQPVSPVSGLGVLVRLLVALLLLPMLVVGPRATLLLAAATVALLSRRHRHWQRADVPHRRPAPLVGSMGPLLLHQTSPAHLLADLHLNPPDGRQDCPLVGFYIFDRPALVVRDPDLVRQLLVKEFAAFPDRHTEAPAGDALGRLNMFGARAALWRRLRAATSPAFTAARLRAVLPHVDRCACAMTQRLLQEGAGGRRPVKVRDVAGRCVTDILTGCLFGVEGGALSGECSSWRGAVRRVFGFSAWRALEVLSVFVCPQLRPLQLLRPRFFGAGAERFFRRAFEQLAHQRRLAAAPGDRPAHAFDMLMALASKEGCPEVCWAQASILATAGSDTTATALACCLFELAANPDVQRRLRREVTGCGLSLSCTDLADMPYLHMVIAETLRKYPALPYVERRCRRACRLGSLEVEAGTPVFVSTLGLHHDPRFFPQPHRFHPERFSEDACRDRHPYCYAPFGHGPRSCVGMRLGLLALKLCVARVVSRLRVSLPAESPPQLRFSALALLLAPVGGVPLLFTPIDQHDLS